MDEQAPDGVWIVPTEMGRRDVFWEVVSLLVLGLAFYWAASVPWLRDIPTWVLAVPAVPLGVWILTGEGAADLPYIGAIAGPLRARIGQRRAHEWVLVGANYVRVGPWPRARVWTRSKVGEGWKRFRSIRVRISR